MQVYINRNRESIKTFLSFLLILIIAYLPVSSYQFFIKNDAFNGYFPSKFFISESLESGYLPLWNPYINFGLPQYGDMNSGFWSPITWLVAITFGYNAYSFTTEILFYILISGIGLYLLCRSYGMIKKICIMAGIAYMCCGYMVGHLQHFNWLSGAAFLPFAIWGYNRLLTYFSLKNILLASLTFYLLIASAHPGITIGSTYFFIAYAVFIFFQKKTSEVFTKRLFSFAKKHALLILITGLLSFGLIAGYCDILPHITRGDKINETATLANPFTAPSFLSVLLPFSTVKNDAFFNTDVTMRNMYFSIVFLIFFLVALISRKNSNQYFFLFTGFAFLLLSMGGIVKLFAYNYLPLVGYVRLNGEFAIFVILCFILVAAFTLNNYLLSRSGYDSKIKVAFYLLLTFLLIVMAWCSIKINNTHDSIIFSLNKITNHAGLKEQLKFLIDNISFYDTLWIQGIVQLFIIWLLKSSLDHGRSARLVKICIADLILATLLNIPFTGTGKASVADVQAVLNKSPQGVILPHLDRDVKIDTLSSYQSGLVGSWSFYNKSLDVKRFEFYPVELKTSKTVFYGAGSNQLNMPYLFFTIDSSGARIDPVKFTGNSISLSVLSNETDTLVYKQNIYPHWFIIKENIKSVPINYKGVFMGTTVKKGSSNIKFIFDPGFVKKAMLFSFISFIVCVVSLAWLFFKPTGLSLRRQ